MAATKENMTLRMEPELKAQAAALFKSLGMDLSTATGIFYRQALRYHGLPFEVKLDEPNEVTYATMAAAEKEGEVIPEEELAALKKDVAIWNINSFAEFYMQIEEKYKKDYARSLELIRAERARFRRELEKLPNLRVIPSQANYLMVELLGGLSARAITRELLVNRCILVKDLSPKLGGQQYLRLAVRDTRDNDRLLEALRPLCGA